MTASKRCKQCGLGGGVITALLIALPCALQPAQAATESERSAVLAEVRALLNASEPTPSVTRGIESLSAGANSGGALSAAPSTLLSSVPALSPMNEVTTMHIVSGLEAGKGPDKSLPFDGEANSIRWKDYISDEALPTYQGKGDSIFIGFQAGYNSARPILKVGSVHGDIFIGSKAGLGSYTTNWRDPLEAPVWAGNNVVVGDNAFMSSMGVGNVIMGDAAGRDISGNRNVYLGIQAGQTSKGDHNVAIGDTAHISFTEEVNRAVVVGKQSLGRLNDVIALGSFSVADRPALDATAQASVYQGLADEEAKKYILSTVATTKGALSIGDTTNSTTANRFTRQITGVAAGTDPTDAVNVAQLVSTDKQIYNIKQDLAAGFWIKDDARGRSHIVLNKDKVPAITFKAEGDGLKATVSDDGIVTYTIKGSAIADGITFKADVGETGPVQLGRVLEVKGKTQVTPDGKTYGIATTAPGSPYAPRGFIEANKELIASLTDDTIATLRQVDVNTTAITNLTTTAITNIEAKFQLIAGTGSAQTVTLNNKSIPQINFKGHDGMIVTEIGGSSDKPEITIKAHEDLGKNIDISTNKTISNHDARITQNTTDIANLKNNITNITENDGLSVKYDSTAKDKVTLGGKSSTGQPNGPVALTNLKDGQVKAGSTDAITGNQLHNAAESLKNVIGGNATNTHGTISSTDIGNTGKNTIHDAIASINNTSSSAIQSWRAEIDGTKVKDVTKDSPNLNFATGHNMTLTNDNGSVKIGTSKNVTFDTVTTNHLTSKTITVGDTTITNEGLTIKNGPSVTNVGINANHTTITNVKPGTNPSDAATVGQVDAVAQTISSNWASVTNKMHGMDRRISGVGAMASAFSAMLPLDYDEAAPTMFSVGFGHYSGQNAIALGVQHYANRDLLFNGGVSWNNNEQMFRLGATWRMGRSDPNRTQKVGGTDPKVGERMVSLEKTVQTQGVELKEMDQNMIEHMQLTVKQSRQIAEQAAQLQAQKDLNENILARLNALEKQ